MILSKEQVAEFETAAKPLIKFLNELGNPHVTAIVTTGAAEVSQGLAMIKCEEFFKD